MNGMSGKRSKIHYSNGYFVTFSQNFVYVLNGWTDRNLAKRFVKIMEQVKMLDKNKLNEHQAPCEGKKIMMR